MGTSVKTAELFLTLNKYGKWHYSTIYCKETFSQENENEMEKNNQFRSCVD